MAIVAHGDVLSIEWSDNDGVSLTGIIVKDGRIEKSMTVLFDFSMGRW